MLFFGYLCSCVQVPGGLFGGRRRGFGPGAPQAGAGEGPRPAAGLSLLRGSPESRGGPAPRKVKTAESECIEATGIQSSCLFLLICKGLHHIRTSHDVWRCMFVIRGVSRFSLDDALRGSRGERMKNPELKRLEEELSRSLAEVKRVRCSLHGGQFTVLLLGVAGPIHGRIT